jgi:hypothetical protein
MAVVEQSRVDVLVPAAARYLERVYRAQDALFPFSSLLVGRGLVNDYSHRLTLRYTINSFLGLQSAGHELASEVPKLLRLQETRVRNAGDIGLLNVLAPSRRRVAPLQDVAPERLMTQELAWATWGACAAESEPLARRFYDVLRSRFVDERIALPQQTLTRGRRGLVCFGVCVYALRALHEFALLTGDEDARRLFRAGVERLVGLQGPQGEWPWMLGVRTGLPLDPYPVYAVHQDSMAMLFLLPALDLGLDVSDAIDRSLAWVFGANELGERMFLDDPPFFHRSIRRDQGLRHTRRYLRATARALVRRPAGLAGPGRVVVKRECRSYHPGWILYAWAGR